MPPPLLLLPLLPPHPTQAMETAKSNAAPSAASQPLRLGTRKNSRRANAVPPVEGQKNAGSKFRTELVAAVVRTTSTTVGDMALLTETDGTERMQVGGSLGVEILVVTAQLSATAPLKPFAEVSMRVDQSLEVSPAFTLMLPLFESLKPADPAVPTRAVSPMECTNCPVESVPTICTL